MDFQVLSVFVKQEQDKIITNKMGIHVEIFLKKALKQVKCLKNQEKVEPGHAIYTGCPKKSRD